MSGSHKIDTGQSESTEDKEAVCDESDLITESIEELEASDAMGQKDRALQSNSDLSEGNLSDGKTDLYEIGSKCDGSPKKLKGNKERRLSECKIKDVEKDGALKGAESNVAMGTEASDKSQAKKEKRKRDRKKRKQNKKVRAGSFTEGGEEKENNLQKVDSSETDISEKDEIVKVKEKSPSKLKKENDKKRKNSVAKKGEKCSDMNENNLESGEQIISLTESKSQDLSSDSEQLRSDSTNSGNEETYDIGKENSDTKVKDDSKKKDEKPPRSSSPSKKKKKKKKKLNKVQQSLDEADDKEALNHILEISKSSKESGEKDSLPETVTNGNNNLTSAEQQSPEEHQSHSSEVKADKSKLQTSEEKQNTTVAPKSEQTSENSKMSEPQTSKEPTSDVVAMETKDDVTEFTSEPVAKENSDDVTEVTNATTDIKELLSEIKDVLSEFPADGCRESSVDPEDPVSSENANNSDYDNAKSDVADMEELRSAQTNNSLPDPEVKMANETGPQNCSENKGTLESVEKLEKLTECSKDTANKDLLVEERSENLEKQSEISVEKSENSVEISETLDEKPENLDQKPEISIKQESREKSESETPDNLCKDNVADLSAIENSKTLNSEVKDILSNMVDNVHENSKSGDAPKVSESVVPDHVDLSDIEDVSIDSVASEDLPQSKKCDSEIHVPLNPSQLRDELVKLESENLSVIADLEKDASLLEGNQSTEQQADVSASQSKEDNSQRVSQSQEADAEDVVDLMNNSICPSSNDPMELSVDCVDGCVPESSQLNVVDAAESDLITKPVVAVQDVGVETEADAEKIQMREEIERLKEELNSTKDALQKSQSQVYRQQIHSSLTVSTLQAQLHKKDMQMKQTHLSHDQQIEAVISRLFLLEGEIRREQKQILGLLDLKETVIDRQSQKIEELIDTNDKLSLALKLHNIGTNGLITPLNRSTGDLSPTNKASFKDKESPKNMKLRWGTVKDKLRRHKSSFELHHPDRTETLEEGTFRYGSQENLSNSKRVNDRKERCRSYAEYPQSLRNSPLVELPNENDYQKSDESETTSLNMAEGEINDGQCSPSSSSDDNSIISDISSLGVRRGSITSLPNGVGLISPNRGSSPNIHKDVCELSPHEKPVKQSSPSSNHHGESNPFKSIKTMLKRQGSKLRSKKRSSTEPQLNESEPKEAMKNHFKKYEMH